jgi:mono/diheme cytochrome c family protein
MKLRFFFLFLPLFSGSSINLSAESREEILLKGKELYNSAGSCVACHMPNGNGQKGSVPPLSESDWLKGGSARSIAISLRGLAGPIKVNGKKYYSAMPPQLLFDDQKLAYILSYVNNAWGNKEALVSKEEVAQARRDLPQDVFTPQSLLKRFPFDKKHNRKNGTFTPTFDDMISEIIEPIVYRTFMPGASPAAFAVALPGNHYFCWDAGECRLRYVWSKGGFIRANQNHWSSNGKPVAEFNGTPYYRARTSQLSDESFEVLSKTNNRQPIYDTSQANNFPILIEGIKDTPNFLGYRLVEGFPKFRYSLGKHVISELIRPNMDRTGIRRTFTVSPPIETTLRLTPTTLAHLSSDRGKLNSDGEVVLSAKESTEFTIMIRPLEDAN